MGDNGSKPLDVKTAWLNVARRMQSVAKTDGLAIITIAVLVDQDGNPRFWLEPQCRRIEPRRSTTDILNLILHEDSVFLKEK